MNTRWTWLAVLACVVVAGGCASPGVESIEPFVDDIVPEGSSGTLVAALDGEIVECQGWGEADRAGGVEADCDTVYDVMSMTKQFTAAAVLKLQLEGRLDVADPMGTHLADVPADKQDITVHHLLTHTSGLPDSLGGDYEEVSRSDLVEAALASDLSSQPGEAYHYSNLGYSLLAVIVENASGVGYEEYLADNMFTPVGMTSTGYVLPDWSSSTLAVEYDYDGSQQGSPLDHPWAADGPYWNLRGNGGMLSTARDMFRWHEALEGDLDPRRGRQATTVRAPREGGAER